MKKYYGVIYLHSGEICIGQPEDTEEACVAELKKAVAKHFDRIKATTYMVREDGGEFLLGHPKSRDLMQDKKFIKSLEQTQ